MADNRHSSVILVCNKCGAKIQAIAPTVGRRCACGGELVKRAAKELGK